MCRLHSQTYLYLQSWGVSVVLLVYISTGIQTPRFYLTNVCITMTSHGRYGVSNHRHLECCFNSLIGLTAMKISKLCINGPLWWDTLGTVGFSSQKARNTEKVIFVFLRNSSVGDWGVYKCYNWTPFMNSFVHVRNDDVGYKCNIFIKLEYIFRKCNKFIKLWYILV